MRWEPERSRAAFTRARVAHLATAAPDATPHLVPIVFALGPDDQLYTAVDSKPKTTHRLRRVVNIERNPAVSVLVDHYDDDWNNLWWARADGSARIARGQEAGEALTHLARRYPTYRDLPPPGPVIAIDVTSWSGWSPE